MSGGVSVRGGAYSIAADFEAMGMLGMRVDALAGRLTVVATSTVGTGLHPALTMSRPLDPVGAMHVLRLLGTVALLSSTARFASHQVGTALRTAFTCYTGLDRGLARAMPVLSASMRVPRSLATLQPTHPLASLERFAVETPGLASVAVDGLTAVLPGGVPLGTRRETALLASAYPDGRPVVRHEPSAPTADDTAPRNLGDLLDGLALRTRDTRGGAIDVRILESFGPDGSLVRSAVVDITGTTDWSPLPGSRVATDLTTNLHALAGHRTSYARGILAAMRTAGVDSHMPVLLAGHSQGGIVATDLARHCAKSREFNVTHVVTAGSPIGLLDVPTSVQVMSLENTGDIVPSADGALNPARSNRLTVHIDRGGPGLLDRHDMTGAYATGARDVDESNDPGVRAWLRGASMFFGGYRVRTEVFQVSRAP